MTGETLFDDYLKPQHPARPVVTVKAPILADFSNAESVDAAVANLPNRGSQRDRILRHLQEWGAATDEQLQDALGMPGSTERPRRLELVERGLVVKAGTATTKSGRRASLWAAA